jgi:hypothetical protein
MAFGRLELAKKIELHQKVGSMARCGREQLMWTGITRPQAAGSTHQRW